jgi:hypothetical protein
VFVAQGPGLTGCEFGAQPADPLLKDRDAVLDRLVARVLERQREQIGHARPSSPNTSTKAGDLKAILVIGFQSSKGDAESVPAS